ncbi:alpha/beta hydrolase [Portibacter lacus]|nr:alpha/beta hydrolase [Portibacter lacus]
MSMFLAFSGCLDLGPLLFNPDTSITEYLWDENPDNSYFDPEKNYYIKDGEFHYFTLESDHEGQVETIHAVYLGDLETIDSDTVIIYNHGNSYQMDVYYPRAQLLYHAGGKSRYGVLMMDYRGFGLSTGEPSESSLLSDVNSCIQWLKDRGLTEDRMIMYGYSLGSIPSVYLTATPQAMAPHKLMLEAPIGSISTMSSNGSGLSMPSSFFADLFADNIEEIKKVKQDLYWIHGEMDNFLNYTTHGEAIYNNHNSEYKIAVPVSNGDHGDTPFKMGEEKYMNSVYEFIKR